MKNVIKYINLLLLLGFSFYYANRITNLIIYKSNLMKQIVSEKDKYKEKSINALIENKYIIPGYSGQEVDELASYYNMKSSNEYSADNLIMKEIKPTISISNHKNLIIKRGNYNKKSVSIVINNDSIYKYAKSNKIKVDHINYLNEICLKDNITKECEYKVEYKQINNLNNLKILPGDIYYIEDLSIQDFKRFIEMINFNDLSIINLRNLISENR